MVNRSEIWWIDFGAPHGSEPGHRRPVLVVSSDNFNSSKISTVIVCPITSNMRLSAAPGNVALSEEAVKRAGLDRDCVVNVSQTVVVDKTRLTKRAGHIDSLTSRKVDDGLRLVLNL